MRRALSLILALVLCLGLCACNANTSVKNMSKEEMLSVATSLLGSNFSKDCDANIERAKDKHIGKVYTFTAIVSEINSDSINAGGHTVYLDKETILDLSVNDCIDIVGRVGSIIVEKRETNPNGASTSYNIHHISFDKAYCLGKTTSFTATVAEVVEGYGFVLANIYDVYGLHSYNLVKIYLDETNMANVVDGAILKVTGKIVRTEVVNWRIDGKELQEVWTIYNGELVT